MIWIKKGFLASDQFFIAKITVVKGERNKTKKPHRTLSRKATMTNQMKEVKMAVPKRIQKINARSVTVI
jgi:hypothetical protein